MPRKIEQIFRVNMIPKVHGQRVRGGFVGSGNVLTRKYQYFRFRDGMDLEKAGIALGAKENPLLPHELLQIGFTNRGVERELLRAKIEDRSNAEINNIIDRIALRKADERTTDNILCAVLWRVGDEFDVLKPYNPHMPLTFLRGRPKEFGILAIAFFNNYLHMVHILQYEGKQAQALALGKRGPIGIWYSNVGDKDTRNSLTARFLGQKIRDIFVRDAEAQGSFMADVLKFLDFPLPQIEGIYRLYGNIRSFYIRIAADQAYSDDHKNKDLFIRGGDSKIRADSRKKIDPFSSEGSPPCLSSPQK